MQWGLRSLPVRLMLAIAGLAIASISSATFLTIDRQRRELRLSLEGQAKLLLKNLELTLVTMPVTEANSTLDPLVLFPYLDDNSPARAVIFGTDGTMLAKIGGTVETISTEILQSLYQSNRIQFYWRQDRLLAGRRLNYRARSELERSTGEQVIARELDGRILVVELSTAVFKQDIRLAWVNALQVALGASAVSTFLALMLSRTITGPLKQMVKATERISSGQFSEQLPEEKGGQELSQVSKAFNRMSAQLESLIIRQRALVRYSLDAIVVLDSKGQVLEYNPAADRMFSLKQLFGDRGKEVVGQSFFQFAIDSPWREELVADILSVQQQNDSCLVGRWKEVEALRADGIRFYAEVSVTNTMVRGDSIFTVTLRDITERHQSEIRLQKSEDRLKQIINCAPVGIALIKTATGIIQQVNPALGKIVGFDESDIVGCPFKSLGITLDWVNQHPLPQENQHRIQSTEVPTNSDRSLPKGGAKQAIQAPQIGQTERREQRYRCKDGKEIWLGTTVTALAGIGRGTDSLVMIEDITERKHIELQLRHDALHDSLTGLPNRTLLLKRLSRACDRFHSFKSGHDFAVLFIDCDRFKEINDSMGHEVGDRLLIALANRLEDCLREGDTVARLGGGRIYSVVRAYSR